MNFITGLLILIVAFGALYFMGQQGLFAPVSGFFNAVNGGFGAAYPGAVDTETLPPSSPLYQQVKIGFVSLGTGIGGTQELHISAHPKNGGVNVTGWSVRTENGKFVIPKVYNIYSPSTSEVPPENIFMREGDRLVIYSGVSPTKRNERVTQSEYRVWMGDFIPLPHGNISLRDENGYLVDQYTY
jgi:hypothetical protein